MKLSTYGRLILAFAISLTYGCSSSPEANNIKAKTSSTSTSTTVSSSSDALKTSESSSIVSSSSAVSNTSNSSSSSTAPAISSSIANSSVITSHSSAPSPTPPSIDTPISLSWDENQPLAYHIVATGGSTLSYQLLQSPDSELFSLNENSGLLTTEEGVDFEAPTDANNDGVYELSIIVSDQNKLASIHGFSISINDLTEYTTEVIFPIEGSNVGGFAKSITIRCQVTENKQPLKAIPEGAVITVNGKEATFIEGKIGQWAVEMPISQGLNTFTINSSQLGALESSTSLRISNTPIKGEGGAISIGDGFIYNISYGSEGILSEDTTNNQTTILTSVDSISSAYQCVKFSGLRLNKNGNKLAISCQTSNNENRLFIYDLTSKVITETEHTARISYKTKWLDDHLLLIQNSANSYTILDTKGNNSKKINITHNNSEVFLYPNFGNDGYTIFIESQLNNTLGSSYFNLTPAIESNESEITITAFITASNTILNDPPIIINGFQYSLDSASINKLNIETGITTQLTITSPDSSTLPEPSEGSLYIPVITHNNTSQLIIRDLNTNTIYQLRLKDSTLVRLYSNKNNSPIRGNTDISIKPDNTELAVYDLNNHRFVTIDLNTYTINQQYDFSDIVDTTQYTFGRIAYDWDKQIIYRHRVFSWGTTEPNNDGHIVATDVQNHSHKTIISGYDLDVISGAGTGYRVGDTIITDRPNELWFSLLIFEDNNPLSTQVYTYNIETKISKLLYTLDPPADVKNYIGTTEPFLSEFSSELQTSALTAWNNGYLSTLKADGATQELIPPLSPYIISLNSAIDSANGRIFMAGFSPQNTLLDPLIEYVDYDQNSLEIAEVGIATGQRKVIASRSIGNGLPLDWATFQYNESRELIMDVVGGKVFIIDPYSGDRVLKAISNKSTESNSSNTSSGSSSSSAVSSSSSSSPHNTTPPTLVTWDENQPFLHNLPTTNEEPVSYQLLKSPDSSIFVVDEKTGIISTKEGFNFEAPTDANNDGKYELNIILISQDNQISQHNFIISINNLIEHKNKVIFPIEGSNVGGFAKKIHIRGQITENGNPTLSIPDGMTVSVNNTTATYTEGEVGEWIIEVPISYGQNIFTIDLKTRGIVESSTSLRLENTPIKNISTSAANGKGLIYSISYGQEGILVEDTINNQTRLVASNNSISESSNCASFDKILLNKGGDKLAISCLVSDKESGLFIYDNKNKIIDKFANNIINPYRAVWLDDNLLFSQKNNDNYIILNTATKKITEVTVTHNNPNIQLSSSFNNDGYRIFIASQLENDNVSSYFDLSSVIGDDVSTVSVTAYAADSNILIDYRPMIKNGFQYTLYWSNVEKLNIETGEKTRIPIADKDSTLLFGPNKSHYINPNILYIDASQITIGSAYTGGAYKLNLEKSELITLSDGITPISIDSDISISPDNNEIAIYDLRTHTFITVNLNDYQAIQKHDFSDIVDTTQYTFGRIAYDWDNQIIYRHRVFNWGGSEPSDDGHIVETDILNHTHRTIISGYDLETISGAGTDYRMGDVILTDNPNELWFSLLANSFDTIDVGYKPLTQIFTFDIETKISKLLYTLEQPSGALNYIGSNEPFLSEYSSELQASALTAWSNGHLSLLRSDGSAQELIPPLSPYITSLNSAIDATNNRIFMAGFLPEDPSLDPYIEHVNYDRNTLEISAVNILTGQRKVIASRHVGNGLPFDWTTFQYDESRGLIMDATYGHIFILDPTSGDRVLKSIELP